MARRVTWGVQHPPTFENIAFLQITIEGQAKLFRGKAVPPNRQGPSFRYALRVPDVVGVVVRQDHGLKTPSFGQQPFHQRVETSLLILVRRGRIHHQQTVRSQKERVRVLGWGQSGRSVSLYAEPLNDFTAFDEVGRVLLQLPNGVLNPFIPAFTGQSSHDPQNRGKIKCFALLPSLMNLIHLTPLNVGQLVPLQDKGVRDNRARKNCALQSGFHRNQATEPHRQN